MPETTLSITKGAHEFLRRLAQENKATEFVGLLSRNGDASGPVDGVYLLPAEASGSHATATATAILQAVDDLRSNRRHPIGLVHSHGRHRCFHSGTDEATIARSLPAMAQPLPCDTPAIAQTPQVVAPDEAILPLGEGRLMRFSLIGPTVGGGIEATYRAAWAYVETTTDGQAKPPRASFPAERELLLEAGQVTLKLGLPPGTSVTQQVLEPGLRQGIAYSVVVNDRGETFAEALLVCDFAGESLTKKVPCKLEVVGQEPVAWNAANRQFLRYQELTSQDAFRRPRTGAFLSVWSDPDDGNH